MLPFTGVTRCVACSCLSSRFLLWGLSRSLNPHLPPRRGAVWVIPLTVYPVAEPKPALKYLLLPEARDINPGNQIPAFYKCFMEQHNFYRSKESIDQREIWVKAPLQELAPVKALIGYGGASTRQSGFCSQTGNSGLGDPVSTQDRRCLSTNTGCSTTP